MDELKEILRDIADRIEQDLKHHKKKGRTVTIKVRYANFETITRSKTIETLTDDANIIYQISKMLLEKTEAGKRKIHVPDLAGPGCSSGRTHSAGICKQIK